MAGQAGGASAEADQAAAPVKELFDFVWTG